VAVVGVDILLCANVLAVYRHCRRRRRCRRRSTNQSEERSETRLWENDQNPIASPWQVVRFGLDDGTREKKVGWQLGWVSQKPSSNLGLGSATARTHTRSLALTGLGLGGREGKRRGMGTGSGGGAGAENVPPGPFCLVGCSLMAQWSLWHQWHWGGSVT
jgi:hypothetical protein